MSVSEPDLLAFSAAIITIEMLLRFSSIALSSPMHVMIEMQNDTPATQRSDLNSLLKLVGRLSGDSQKTFGNEARSVDSDMLCCVLRVVMCDVLPKINKVYRDMLSLCCVAATCQNALCTFGRIPSCPPRGFLNTIMFGWGFYTIAIFVPSVEMIRTR